MEYSTIKKHGINYLTDQNGRVRKFKPWLSELFSFLYDRIMEKSIFPKLFGGRMDKHFEILAKEFKQIHHKTILEIGTGSGTLSAFLSHDNKYVGIDISTGLLKKAVARFRKHGFTDFELYNVEAEALPFDDGRFDFAVCNLSLNFISDIDVFLQLLKKALRDEAVFFCSVPIPERKPEKSKIRGRLYSEQELKEKFMQHGFEMVSLPYYNGAVLYFTATLIHKEKI